MKIDIALPLRPLRVAIEPTAVAGRPEIVWRTHGGRTLLARAEGFLLRNSCVAYLSPLRRAGFLANWATGLHVPNPAQDGEDDAPETAEAR